MTESLLKRVSKEQELPDFNSTFEKALIKAEDAVQDLKSIVAAMHEAKLPPVHGHKSMVNVLASNVQDLVKAL